MNTTDNFYHRGNKIVYNLSGKEGGPALILVHGWLSCKEMWRQSLPLLEKSYTCVALDLIGHGESDKPDSGYDIPDQAERVLALADALGFERFSLLGHSMGGMIVLYLAAGAGQKRVDRLVNVDGILHPQFSPALLRLIRRLRMLPLTTRVGLEAARAAVQDRHVRDVMLNHAFYQPENRAADYDKIDLPAALQPGMEKALVLAADAIMQMDIRPDLGRIACPTLTIFGEQDPLVPPTQGREAQGLIPDCRLVMIPKCGHMPMHEKPAEYLAALGSFLIDQTAEDR